MLTNYMIMRILDDFIELSIGDKESMNVRFGSKVVYQCNKPNVRFRWKADVQNN